MHDDARRAPCIVVCAGKDADPVQVGPPQMKMPHLRFSLQHASSQDDATHLKRLDVKQHGVGNRACSQRAVDALQP